MLLTHTLIVIPILMAIIDAPYLTLTAANFKPMIMRIQGSALEFRVAAAIPVYLALAYLLTYANSWQQAAAIGAATYAVYDFTNYATIKNYTLSFALQDSLWGGILFALTWLAAKKLNLLS
jgi:uncharacterized membrane protein